MTPMPETVILIRQPPCQRFRIQDMRNVSVLTGRSEQEKGEWD